MLRDDTLQAARKANEALGVLGEELHIDPRFVVKAMHVRLRRELSQILIALKILREQAHMVNLVLSALGPFGHAVVVHEVDFRAQNRLNAMLFGALEETGEPKQIPMVGDGEGLHAKVTRPFAQPVHVAAAIKKAVVGVDVKMDKFLILRRHVDEFWRSSGFVQANPWIRGAKK